MAKQPDRYDCDHCERTDLPTADIVTRTVVNQRPGEADLYVQATLDAACDDVLDKVLSEFGFRAITEAEATGALAEPE